MDIHNGRAKSGKTHTIAGLGLAEGKFGANQRHKHLPKMDFAQKLWNYNNDSVIIVPWFAFWVALPLRLE
jgi:hypothetical protein